LSLTSFDKSALEVELVEDVEAGEPAAGVAARERQRQQEKGKDKTTTAHCSFHHSLHSAALEWRTRDNPSDMRHYTHLLRRSSSEILISNIQFSDASDT
jgi:hypothetical protein